MDTLKEILRGYFWLLFWQFISVFGMYFLFILLGKGKSDLNVIFFILCCLDISGLILCIFIQRKELYLELFFSRNIRKARELIQESREILRKGMLKSLKRFSSNGQYILSAKIQIPSFIRVEIQEPCRIVIPRPMTPQSSRVYPSLEPVWFALMKYIEVMENIVLAKKKWDNRKRFEYMKGIDEYIDFLKNDIATGLGISKEQLTNEVLMSPDKLVKLVSSKNKTKEFRVNEYITLRLEREYNRIDSDNWKTNIYVNGERFRQCKFLLLNLDTSNEELMKQQEQIESIDDAAKLLNGDMEHDHSIISPEEEFHGHCSNIQAWVENNYDSRIIHTNLGLPLAVKLAELGVEAARMAVVEEITDRILKDTYRVEAQKKYLKFFTVEESDIIKRELLKDKSIVGSVILEWFRKLGFSDGCVPLAAIPNLEMEDLGVLEPQENRFAAGDGMDNHVGARGDFISTINNGLELLVSLYGQAFTPIWVWSNTRVRNMARSGVHVFYTTAESPEEFTELDIINRMPEIGAWETNNIDITEDIIIMIDLEGNGVRTGRLDW